jgi:FtsP/CotA-like multicopper oxidase with cupredoxin domain
VAGRTFYKHFPNHGFVGDVFTVNGKAYPVLNVDRRKYRFRFLDASISRIYDFKLMSSTKGPKTAVSLRRNGKDVTPYGVDKGHIDDYSHEDLVALDPGESVMVYRGFRDFVGPYVGHCHNLAHENHAMMFGWEITA